MSPEHIAKLQAGRANAKSSKHSQPSQQLNHPRVQIHLKIIELQSPQYATVTHTAYSGTSKSAAIKAKCLDCSCWQRLEITHCSVITCPLWNVRPYQKDSNDSVNDAQ